MNLRWSTALECTLCGLMGPANTVVTRIMAVVELATTWTLRRGGSLATAPRAQAVGVPCCIFSGCA
eukprot:2449621-Amphidinium_carterae.1